MISKTDALINSFERVVSEPWNQKLSGQEKVWFLVYDPAEQRKVMFRLGDFERVALKHSKNWVEIDLKSAFAQWMVNHKYREQYFKQPTAIKNQVESRFRDYVVSMINNAMDKADNKENTLFAVTNVNALFGFVKLSNVLQNTYQNIEGRVLIFFPGEFQNNQYRLMDARDGWSYLARPITVE